MRYIKLILILFLIIVVSGCTAQYELEIKDNEISEKLILLETRKELFDTPLSSGFTTRELFDYVMSDNEFANDNYEVKSLNSDEQLGIEYNSGSIVDVINSSILNQCYINPTMTENEGIITINTGSNFKCYEYYENLETINVVLKTNHGVINSNADSVDGNKYTWNITKDGNKQIEFSYDTTKTSGDNLVIIVIISVLVFIVLIGLYVFSKMKKENRI